jgi:hypothetical protein
MACYVWRYGSKPTTRWSTEVNHVTSCHSHCSPPRATIIGPSRLDQLWSLLTDEQRQRTLVTLSGIVVRQLDAPRDDGEVRDAHS